MRNSNAYKNDPANPTDLLGRPIKEGDFVVFPAMSGRSARSTVARIEKINFKAMSQSSRKYVPCPQHVAERYSLTLEPYQSSKSYWSAKHTTIQNVDNVVRLDLPPGQPAKLVS